MKVRIALTTAATAGLLAAMLAAAGPASASNRTIRGCPSGAACTYGTFSAYDNSKPTQIFYSYGSHNISGYTGNGSYVDNQTGSAGSVLCTGSNGTGTVRYGANGGNGANDYSALTNVAWDPIYSIKMVKTFRDPPSNCAAL